MTKTACVVGAGLAGRLLALDLADHGWDVRLLDKDDEEGRESCTYASAGMLAPSCELETDEQEISALDARSLALWPALLERLESPVFFRQRGSLVVAHPQDRDELQRLKRKVQAHPASRQMMRDVTADEIAELEPELAGRFDTGLYLPHEAHVANRDVLNALRDALHKQGVSWTTGVEITRIEPHLVEWEETEHRYDWVVDCRGMGARADLKDLRGVRGEIVTISAPEVQLNRPVRLMHPRYSIYIVPRDCGRFLVGATAIEAEDYSPMSVRSALELLSAAYTLHPGFAEGRILELTTSCRPAFPDHRPRIDVEDGLMRINGLYRHGFLLAPSLVEFARKRLEGETVGAEAMDLFQE